MSVAYSRTGAIIVTEPGGRVRSFAADSDEGVALLDSGVVPAPYVAPVPQVVSRFQARMALRNAGLFDQVESRMQDAGTPGLAREAWASAQVFERDSPTIAAMAAVLGMDARAVDDLFVAADKVRA